MSFELTEGGRDSEKAQEQFLISEILREAIFEHDERNFRVFRAHLSYGSKFLDCYVNKDSKKAGDIIEARTSMPKKENETSLLYKSFFVFLCGVANRIGESLSYTLITENAKLVAWARTHGNDIFHWTDTKESDGVFEFSCEVRPSVSPKKALSRKLNQETTVLIWEAREEFKK